MAHGSRTETFAGSGRGSSSPSGSSSRTSRPRTAPSRSAPRSRRAWLAERLAIRRAPLKAVLLDQRVVAGLGNIYADEALWRARISPLLPANALATADVGRLRRAIRASLETGIERQGSTLRDYAKPDGSAGGMQDEFRVYGREGEPCPRCREPIAKTRVGGRGTWYCPRCQPDGVSADRLVS